MGRKRLAREAKESFEHALAVTERVTGNDGERRRRKEVTGVKRTMSRYNTFDTVPLDGLDIKRSNMLRKFMGLRLGGARLEDAASDLGVAASTISAIIHRHPDAYNQALLEIGSRFTEEYEMNMLRLRTALSEAGPKAIETLKEVMEDQDTAAGNRVKAAQAILKLLNIDGSASTGVTVNVKGDLVKFLKLPEEPVDGFAYVVDAEEVSDGGEDGVGDPV